MSISNSLLPEHFVDDEVHFIDGAVRCAISVSREQRGQEEICYLPRLEALTEAALSHSHGTSKFELDVEGDDVDEVLKLADAHFRFDTTLKQKYPGGPWSKHTEDDVDWEGQHSILVGRSEGAVIGIVCLRMHFLIPHEASNVRFLNIGIGPFFVPASLRRRAHAIEMSIAASHLSSVLLDALYAQMPKFGRMGVVIACDFSAPGAEPHPFAEQIFQKIEVTQELLGLGLETADDAKRGTIFLYPPRLTL